MYYYGVVVSLLLTLSALSQPKSDSGFLEQQYRQRLQLERKASLVLGGWGMVNVVSGAIGASQNSGSTKYFHQMNLGWGVINTGLAVLVRGNASRKLKEQPAAGTIFRDQRKLENILMLNTGLDVAYMAIGWGLKEKAAKPGTTKPERLEGFGNSLLLQGGFLFAFDVVQYMLHRRQGRAMEQWLDGVSIQPAGNGLSIVWQIR